MKIIIINLPSTFLIILFLTVSCSRNKVYEHAIKLPINQSIGNVGSLKFMPDNESILIYTASNAGDEFYKLNYIHNYFEKVFKPSLNKYLPQKVSCDYNFILNYNNLIIFDWMSEERRVVYLLNIQNYHINKFYLKSNNIYRVQSTGDHFYFIEDYIDEFNKDKKGIYVLKYPNNEMKYELPNNFNKLGIDHLDDYCFGKNINEIYLTCINHKLKKRNIYEYNYITNKTLSSYDLPYDLIDKQSFESILLSPDGRYLALSHIVLGLYILDLINNTLYDIDVFSTYFHLPAYEVDIMDWSWNSKHLLIYLTGHYYLVPIDKIEYISRKITHLPRQVKYISM